MKISFKRITSTGNFIPEIDGLRFIAIVSVVLYHLSGFLIEKDHNQYIDNYDYSFLKMVLSRGHLGVPLFFTISGFILGLPFAKYFIANGKPINLKKYFLRRLTRLEPPYILAMTIILFGAVYVAKTISFDSGFTSYLYSLAYSHNFFYKTLPLIGPAWSLEIEVQFYILAPIMAYFFAIKLIKFRRGLIVGTLLFLMFLNYYIIDFPFKNLFDYVQYFLIGFLLADFYVSDSTILIKTKFDNLIGVLLFITIWIIDKNNLNSILQKFIWELIQLTSIFFLYYYILFHKIFKFLSYRLITNIGGMCYSIYLLHYPIISMFGNPLLKYSFSKYSFINITIYSILLITVIMVISSLFFLFIERPCMDKDWFRKLINRPKKFQLKKINDPRLQ